MKILAKLLIGFLAVAAICGVIGILGITQLNSLNSSIKDMAGNTIPTLTALDLVEVDLRTIDSDVKAMANPLAIDDDTYIKEKKESIQAARDERTKAIAQYDSTKMEPQEKMLWEAFKATMPAAVAYTDSIVALVDKARKMPATVQASTGTGTSAKVSGVPSPERQAIYSQLAEKLLGDEGKTFNTMVAAHQKVQDFDRQFYTIDQPKAIEAGAAQAVTIVVIMTILAFVAAVAIGLFLGTSMSTSIKKIVERMGKIAAGDMSQKLDTKSKDELGVLAVSVNLCIDNISSLVTEAGLLEKAAEEGKLATRADASKHQGDYRKIVDGVNKTLDAVIGPLNVAANYVDKISKGDLPPKITDSYNGDFNSIKNNLNVAIASINALVEDAGMLEKAAADGRLATRADGSKHQGDYRKIVDGVNKTLDLVITPVNETVVVLKRLADGDLTLRMTGDYKGDFDILKTALNDSLEAFNDTLVQVNEAVDQVAEGSLQVSQASQSLSQGATEQASSLEEITSSVTEIASQTKLNTENAGQVNSLAVTAKTNAEQGNAQMQNLVAAMGDINKSAEEIKKIVKAIDDISFQINLLALNANVEAARAGKYGKGFAVVAEEVRNLAVRSANSVKETTAMVDDTITNIGRGNALCDLTAKQLAEIVGGAGQVATLAEEVAIASKEQTQGLEQVSTGLNQIDQVTQANTASSEESASASEELSSQSQQVKAMLSRFKLKAKEGKLNNTEVMQMLRSEMAKQGAGQRGATGAQRALPVSTRKGKATAINPADVISLDDENFGKF